MTNRILVVFIGFIAISVAISISVHSQPGPPAATQQVPTTARAYVGSQACADCHFDIYQRWSKTRMANVVADPRVHPEAVIPDFTKADPLLTFTLDDVALTYGSKWKQRYFKRVGDDFYPLPAQWDVSHRIWRTYSVQPNTDWWVPFYGADNMQRPTGSLCDGCHSVGYDVKTKTPVEWNVGCERCHGPGSEHAGNPGKTNIVNPAKLDYVRANDTCIQCHSQGQPLKNALEGPYYDWPVGFHQGANLKDFWKLEEHKLGETSFTHFADGTGHKNRMQGNDFVQSLMYRRGVTCFSCHDVHGTSNNADLIRPVGQICLTCHNASSPNGPRAATIEEHTHHAAASTGSECVNCHMPKIEQTIADINVRSHTFNFITPAMTEKYKIPNPCTSCHAGQTTEWARETMKTWSNVSPWRVN